MAKRIFAPVSQKALIGRINRQLKKQDEILRVCRPNSRAYYELGDYYIVDFYRNFIVNKNIDLEALGRELKVLADWEQLEVKNA